MGGLALAQTARWVQGWAKGAMRVVVAAADLDAVEVRMATKEVLVVTVAAVWVARWARHPKDAPFPEVPVGT